MLYFMALGVPLYIRKFAKFSNLQLHVLHKLWALFRTGLMGFIEYTQAMTIQKQGK